MPPPGNRQSLSLLRNRYFLLYCTKLSATNLGYTLYMITVPAYAFLTSRSILFTGIVLFIEYGIYSLTFFAGPLVDRVHDKRFAISASEFGIGFSALLLGLEMLFDPGNQYAFLLLVGVIAVLWDIAWTADHAVLPLIVEAEEIGKANGLTSALGNGHVAAGLAVGGFLFAILDPFYSILIYSACLFFSGAIVLAIPMAIRADNEKAKPGFMAGWKYLVGEQKPMVVLSVVIALFSLFSNAPVLAVSYVYAASSPDMYSVLFSIYYLGSMFAGLLFARKFPGRSLGKAILVSYLVSGTLLFLSVAGGMPLAILVPIWAFLGFSYSLHTPLFSTYLQTKTRKDMLGRAASNLYTFRGATSTAGALVIPVMVAGYGLKLSYLSFGALMALMSVAALVFLPQIRRLAL